MDSFSRTEKDLLGTLTLPNNCLHGIATERALRCSSIGSHKVPTEFVRTLGLIKYACASSNESLGLLSSTKASAIKKAALEIYDGKHDEAFPVEIFQTGGCTPTNMNANEVIKNLAHQNNPNLNIHTNDDCNLGQSTNDVIPTTLNITLREMTKRLLLPALNQIYSTLEEKSKTWMEVIILGRTHTMDAVLMTLGQVFSGYKHQVKKNIENLQKNLSRFLELPIGGTAVGNGINAHPNFGTNAIKVINHYLNDNYIASKNRFEQQSSRDDYVFMAGLLDTLSTTLIKIANDIRWYGSGPAGGLNELILPTTQAGSSCMPGKVNPVVCETLLQACIYTQGNCDMVRRCAVIGGQFQLNTTSMLLIYALIESIRTLAKTISLFNDLLLKDLQVNLEIIKQHVQNSYVILTYLAPEIGYDLVARISQEAQQTHAPIFSIIKKYCPQYSDETLKELIHSKFIH